MYIEISLYYKWYHFTFEVDVMKFDKIYCVILTEQLFI